jgi:tetrapyrrole methylase family protein / MazG family protein
VPDLETLTAPAIWVVGLGPGSWSQLTVGALEHMLATKRLYFRTLVHPTIEPLRARLRGDQTINSFDEEYERAPSFDALYECIVSTLVREALASTEALVYAVPGHPLIGERSVSMLLETAATRGFTVRIVDGLSFIEPVITLLRLDPLATSMALLDGAALLSPGVPSLTGPWSAASSRTHNAGRPLLIGQVYDRRVASACKLWLLDRYPESHPVTVVMAAGTERARTRETHLSDLDHLASFDHLTSVFVPALNADADFRTVQALPYIVARLRAPDGCPWDRKQTLQTLKPHLLEEIYELVAAIDMENYDGIVEEIGDVFLGLSMLAQIGEENGDFDLVQIVEQAVNKLIRRHPHVFGDLTIDSADAVVRNWERIKSDERDTKQSALDGVPVSMPSLVASQVMQRKAASLGFEWHDIEGVYAKISEELRELQAAPEDEILEEAGDLLFVLVSLCRHLRIDADEALRGANRKFRSRFETVEAIASERRLRLESLDAPELDSLWQEAKVAERLLKR